LRKAFEFLVLVLEYSALQVVRYSGVERAPRAADHHVHVIVVLAHGKAQGASTRLRRWRGSGSLSMTKKNWPHFQHSDVSPAESVSSVYLPRPQTILGIRNGENVVMSVPGRSNRRSSRERLRFALTRKRKVLRFASPLARLRLAQHDSGRVFVCYNHPRCEANIIFSSVILSKDAPYGCASESKDLARDK